MKDVRTWLILALLLILVFGWLHYSNQNGKTEISNLKEKLDSAILPHKKALVKLEIESRQVIEKQKTDSVQHRKEKIGYERKIAALTKKQKETKFTGDISKVSKDSLQMGMDYLAQKPVNDSISKAKDNRIVELEEEIKVEKVNTSALLNIANQKIDHTNKMYEDQKVYSDKLEKLAKKQRAKNFFQKVVIGTVTLGVGYVIGLSR